jgi:predicted DNA-binding transcriptional regulator YafY
VGTDEVKLKHSVEERFAFVEFRVFWHGRINRADLIQRFGVSPTQASQDFKLYSELMPENLVYDGVEKAYLCGQNFVPRYADLSAESYLAPLLSISSGLMQPEDSLLRSVPSFHVSPNPSRGVNPLVLRTIVRAVDNAEAIEIRYQSMSSPEPSWRWIEPHAFAHDGFRWHVRAFCLKDRIFKDFLLSRIVETKIQDPKSDPHPAQSRGDEDVDWSTDASLMIAPHPDLSPSQQAAIRLDYGMGSEGVSEIKVKRSMLYYALKRLGLDTDPNARRPQDQQIVLVNRDDVFERKAVK